MGHRTGRPPGRALQPTVGPCRVRSGRGQRVTDRPAGDRGRDDPPLPRVDRRRARRSRASWGRRPTTSSSPCSRSCGASTARTSPRGSTSAAPDRGARGARRPRRERRGGRRRRRHRRRHPHREPQPPVGHRAYQGAATGVGGILRDIFTMGARPIAVMDPLSFGPLDDPAAAGWSRASSAGSPDTATRSASRPSAASSPSTDATREPARERAVPGLLPVDRLVLGAATGVGNLAVLLGSTTGRDGIGGVSVLASAGFSEGDEADDASGRACRWAIPTRRSG